MLNAVWETEGLQTVGIVVIVCASLKLLHLLGLINFSEDSVEDELEMSTVRHRPEGLEQLEAQTRFSRKELQILYRGFKNVSRPSRPQTEPLNYHSSASTHCF
ncbi:hypothetical protein AGOR_G00231580 [Albula goreensis]|uniref:Uncharacterized protein n=1 Tax=Albula goreensis TaxID=1534307 RepID=A0A8T3CHE6_9TELE|nr:hypothetical protein AGOR_G00231580 [Albula goreensis]